MDKLSIQAHNMAALRLEANELAMHEDLMQTEMKYWPENLQKRIEVNSKIYGLSGDVISDIVANWIAHR